MSPMLSLASLAALLIPLTDASSLQLLSGSISGYVSKSDANPHLYPVWVRLYAHLMFRNDLVPLAKTDVDGVGMSGARLPWVASVRATTMIGSTELAFQFQCEPGNYSVVAFRDPFDNGSFDLSHQLGLGWHTGEQCLGGGGNLCTQVLRVEAGVHIAAANVTLRAPRPMPVDSADPSGHGELRSLRGQRVLNIWGNASQRGFAHGFLLATQILDFFEFFVLEDRLQSADVYNSKIFPAMQASSGTFRFTQEFLDAAEGVVRGMQAANTSLAIHSLGRDFQLEDLLAINTYGDFGTLSEDPRVQGRGSCSQFVFFGDETKGTDASGGTVAGRNMDGEIDFRRLTVSHLTVFSVAPEVGRRYISLMWPGFVGTFSGFNEDGLYVMENFGCPPPHAPAAGRQLVSNVDVIASVLQGGRIGPSASVKTLTDEMAKYNSADGGPCSHAAILYFALPRKTSTNVSTGASNLPSGFAFECDRYGAELRQPNAPGVRPAVDTNIFGTNHFLKYKADAYEFELDPDGFRCNGNKPTFYSLWRYAAAQKKIEAWERSGRRVGGAEIKKLLQMVSEGITEHSVVWWPERRVFELAVPQLDQPLWDAPYSQWGSFAFEDLFFTKSQQGGEVMYA